MLLSNVLDTNGEGVGILSYGGDFLEIWVLNKVCCALLSLN